MGRSSYDKQVYLKSMLNELVIVSTTIFKFNMKCMFNEQLVIVLKDLSFI